MNIHIEIFLKQMSIFHLNNIKHCYFLLYIRTQHNRITFTKIQDTIKSETINVYLNPI